MDQSYKGSGVFYRFIQFVLYIFYRLFFSLRAYGKENVPSPRDKRGVILAPNHSSFLDPPILGVTLDRRVTFLAKEYLFNHWFVGPVLRGVGAYPIKSQKDDYRSIRDLIRILKSGCCVVVFPEGTRSLDGKIKEAESGIGFLAAKSGCHVVPVYLHGTYEAFPPKAKMFRRYPVRAVFGRSFIPADDAALMNAEKPYEATSREILRRVKLLRDEYTAKKNCV